MDDVAIFSGFVLDSFVKARRQITETPKMSRDLCFTGMADPSFDVRGSSFTLETKRQAITRIRARHAIKLLENKGFIYLTSH